jgi:hypothetical protein
MATAVLYPTLWVGPAGSGKLTAARAALGASGEPRLQTLEVGDYQARYWEFSTHMEIDIMDLSLMDKQVLPELLDTLLSTREVAGGRRKVLLLRRIHGLSPAAAGRLRAALEAYVWSAGATATVWATARTVNGVVASVMDGFVYRRVEASQRLDRLGILGGGAATIPTLQTYIAEVLRQMVLALAEGPPCLAAVGWIRARVYEMLGLMLTGGELVSSLTWATVRLAAAGGLPGEKAQAVLDVLAGVRWFPSYRTPLMLERVLTDVYEALSDSEAPASAIQRTLSNNPPARQPESVTGVTPTADRITLVT